MSNPSRDFRFEPLEARVLYSADLAFVVGSGIAPVDDYIALAPSGGGNAAQALIGDKANILANQSESSEIGEYNNTTELVIIDAGVPDLEELLADFQNREDAPRVVILEEGNDALGRIGELISNERGLTALHLISHGADGELELGGEKVSTSDLLARADDVFAWRGAFSKDADILIYGCDVAASIDGRAFVDTLSQLTATDVAASIDVTGAANDGGDWQLEYRRGKVESNIVASEGLQDDYQGTFATYTVLTLADSGADSLRAAITAANASGTDDVIVFGIKGTIALTSALPAITDKVTIDGTSAPDYAVGSPTVVIDGSALTSGKGLLLQTGSDDSIIKGLRFQNIPDEVIEIRSSGNTITGNSIGNAGTNVTSIGTGISIFDTTGTVIGGDTLAERNIISGNETHGIYISGGGSHTVQGNYIGTTADGSSIDANKGRGIALINSNNNLIGGSRAAGEGNLISGNATVVGSNADHAGIDIFGASSTGNRIEGNLIGTDSTGNSDLGNNKGIRIYSGANGNTIGGDERLSKGNVISGNNVEGILVSGDSSDNNYIQGNYIGTNVLGDAFLGNDGIGIRIVEADNNTIGGDSTLGEGNIVSANGIPGAEAGISIESAAIINKIFGNIIGLDSTGTNVIFNGNEGVSVNSGTYLNTIGSSTAGYGNIISGNAGHGIAFHSASLGSIIGNDVIGNLIGTDITGMLDRGNGGDGLYIYNTYATKIGGVLEGERNVISGNAGVGLYLDNSDSSIVSGNYIGTNIDDSALMGNGAEGVLLSNGSIENLIGGTTEAEGNTIRANAAAGISVVDSSSYSNAFLLNIISDNAGLGIDIGSTGVLANDSNDSDGGPNLRQNYPVLTQAFVSSPGSVLVKGNFNSKSNEDYRVDVYVSAAGDALGHGEAERYLGTVFTTSDSSGNATFSQIMTGVLSRGEAVSALLTKLDSSGNPQNTSEFSANLEGTLFISAPVSVTTDENTILVFSGANVLEVSDETTDDTPMQLSLAVTNGTLSLASLVGINFLEGADNSDSMVISGLESHLNAALNGLNFTPDTDYVGGDILNISATIGADLHAYYPFDTNALDQSTGTAYNGTLFGGAGFTNDAERGNVLSLDGSGDYVRITGLLDEPANVTLAAWINATDTDTAGAVVISFGASPALYLKPNGELYGFYEIGGVEQFVRSTSSLVGTGWRHVALTIDTVSQELIVYIDGSVIGTAAAPAAIEYDNGPNTYIGRDGNAGAAYDFEGLIDDARIYDRALSSAEIAALATDQYSAIGNSEITVVSANDAPTFSSSLDGAPTYVEGGAAVLFDTDVDVSDVNLDDLNGGNGNYAGASITLVRNAGANSDDVMSFNNGSGITLTSGNLAKNSNVIADFDTTTTAGQLVVTFTDVNGEIPTSADVDNVLRQLVYSNSSNSPPASVQIDWTFDDGNTTSQGTGGALQATGSITVSIQESPDLVVTAPASATTNEDTAFVYTGANVVQVSDGLAVDMPLQVSLSVANGTLSLATLSGITFVEGADGSASIVIEGLESDINTALNGLVFLPDGNYYGSDTLTISVSIAADLQAYYAFENNALDQSAGVVSNGTLQGGVGFVNDLERGNVLSLDGVDDGVVLSPDITFTDQITLSAWINVPLLSANTQKVISLGNDVWLRVLSNGAVSGAFRNADASSWGETSDTQSIVGTGWRHVTYTMDSSAQVQRIYVDGLLRTETTYSNANFRSSNAHAIGRNASAGQDQFGGLIDEARIYSRALSVTEIAALATDQVATTDNVAITVEPINDAPTVDLDADNSAATGLDFVSAWTENSGAVAIADIDASLLDPDNSNLVSMTITIVNLLDGASEVLSANTTGTSIVASYTSGTGVLSLTGSHSVADYQQVLRTITYDNTSDDPNDTARIINFVASDGTDISPVASTSVTINKVNDTPDVIGPGVAYTVSEQANLVIQGTGFGVTDADAGGANASATIVVNEGALTVAIGDSGVSVNSGNGTSSVSLTGTMAQINDLLSGSGTGTITYFNASNAPSSSTTITVTVNDAGNSGSDPGTSGDGSSEEDAAWQTINITAINDAPVLDNTGAMTMTTISEDVVANSGLTVADIIASAGGDRITDVDDSAQEGIAITTRYNGRGQWQYSLDSGSNWSNVGTVDESAALLLQSTDRVRFNTNGENGTTTTFEFRAWDQTSGVAGTKVDVTSNGGSTAFSTAIESVAITVTDVNDAPVLDNSSSLVLTTQAEDAGAPSGVVGTAITDLVSFGGNVTDVDGSSQTGVAITAANQNNGVWWYTLDSGTTWNALGDVSEASTRVLDADSDTRIYFQSNTDFNGSVSDAITFRAWDHTSGSSGSLEDTTSNGGTTAYSSEIETADLTITPVNDVPQLVGASVIVNGDFSMGLSDWTSAGNVDDDGVQARFGQIGGTNGSLSQTFSTQIGMTYVVSFQYGDGSATQSQNLDLDVTGAASLLSVPLVSGVTENTLQTYQYRFVADSTSSTIIFTDTSADHSGVRGYLDNVEVVTDALSSAPLTYTENDGAIVVDSLIDIEDIDDTNIESAVVQITSNFVTSEDVLTFSDQNGIAGTFNSSDGSLSLLGSASLANYETALSSITYTNTSDNPGTSTRTVSFTVNDGGGVSNTQTRDIDITSVNDAPVINSAATATAQENQTSVQTVTSTDADGGSRTYSITGGSDFALFSVGGISGELTFDTARNFEQFTDSNSDGVYEVEVTADDGNTGTDSQLIAVTVTDVNEAPLITSDGGGATSTVNVAENQTSVTTVVASDVDASDTQSYSISGGADQAEFSIIAATGVLSFDTAPDHEIKNSYEVEVTVTDGNGLTDVQMLNVIVDDINEAPMITSNGGGDTGTVSVDENQTAVTTVTATDEDVSDTHTYSLGGTDASAFDIGSSDGVLTFNPAPDHEVKDTYVVDVIVADNGTGALTDTQTLTVTVEDVNDAPVITSDGGGNTGTVSVDENQTAVTTVTVTDDDAGDTHTYSLGGTDASAFDIGSSDGVLTFNPAPDHEVKDTYVVDVIVTDNGTGALTDTQTLTITVDDVNEAPEITSNGGGATALISVDENQTAVTTVTATDDDVSDTHTYSLGGTDASAFAIGGSDGVLTFNPAPDHEAKDTYVVNVIVTDNGTGALTDTQTLTITVDDINDAPVITSNGGSAIAPISVDENQTAVTTVTVADDDVSDTHTYSLGGTDASAFDIGSTDGVLTFNPAPDHEVKETYVVDVIVTDNGTGALTDTQTLTITVDDVNEAPVITSNGGGDTGSVSVDENQTAVATVTATDEDVSDTHTYSLGGTDASAFDIGSSDGVLTFNPAPDHEVKETYVVDVIVADNGTGALTDTQTLTVTVDDVNDAPVITSDGGGNTVTVSVDENRTAVTTVTVTDDDAGDTHTYSLGGTDASAFDIGSSDGVLTFDPAPDHEVKDTYVVDVIVADNGTGALTDTQTLTVTVDDVNDAPVITSDGGGNTGTVSVDENQTAVTTVTVTDDDAGDTHTYSLGGTDASAFAIGSSNGVLTFNPAPDHEAKDTYIVEVIVTDNGTGALTDTQTLTITVDDVNDAPVITSNGGGNTGTVSVDENQTAVTTVTATDEDVSDTHTYSLGGTDASAFDIGSTDGVLTFNPAPDHEVKDTYVVDVIVTDNGTGALTDTQTLTITVDDVNDAPMITSNGGGATAPISVDENQTAVTTVTVTDDDAGDTHTYSLGGTDASAFDIGSSDGVLTFNAAPDHEVKDTYIVDVIVTDNGTGALTDTQTLTVTVDDVNDAPVITSDGGGETAPISVDENQTAVTTVTVTDDDAGDTHTYSLSGTDASAFDIGSTDGVLTFNPAPDHEAKDTYIVEVIVTDNGTGALTDTQTLTITVDDVNDAPVITNNGGGNTGTVSVDENQTAVTTVTVTDDDAGDTHTYSLGGTDASAFDIGSTDGVLTFNPAPDHEVKDTYVVDVIVTDNGTGALTDTQTLTITVDDVNDAPVITSNGGGNTGTVSVDENQTAVTTVTVTDDDAGDTHTYSLGGTDASAFDIGSSDGVLTFNPAPDHETKDTYIVDVIVTDNGTGALTDTQTLTITVDDVNDAPVITSNGGGDTGTVSVDENQTAVTTVTATDDDMSDTRTYSLGGTDASAFDIGSSDGVLTFNPAPDHEVKDTYVVDVIVTDNGMGALSDTQTLTITVDDVNDAPVITSNGGGNTGTVSVDENQTAVTTVTVTDDDAGDTHTYSLSGLDASAFDIGSTDGVLTFNPAPDHEVKDTYVVDVIVTDNGTGALTDTQTLTVTVDDVNDAPVITSDGGGNTGTVSVDENQTAVTTVTVTDDDAGDTHTYSLGGTDASAFDIGSTDGVLTFNAAPDNEAKDTYIVDVIVTDNGTGALTDTQTLTITVDDVNDAPVITSNGGGATAPISVDENQTAVTTVTVADDDVSDTHTYSLGGTDASAFDIGSTNGVLTFNLAPDHEVKDTYVVDVIVTDNGTGALTDTQTLTVTVDDVNDAPVITSNGGSDTGTVSVDENQTTVTTVTATDDDGSDTHTYSLGGMDASAFDIGSSDGVLTFNPAPDHEVKDTYVVDVIVTDNGSGALTDTQTLTITVDDVNDAPVITSNGGGNTGTVSVDENQTSVTTVTVTDDDTADTHTYSLSGLDASAFDIDSSDGVLTFNPAPDHEVKDTYVVDVIVTDNGTGALTDTQTLTVTVDDVNDAPVITSDGGGATAAISVDENQTAVTTVTVTDDDAGDTHTYSLSGTDASAFAIGSSNGVLTFNPAPDHEAKDTYVVDVIVTDSGTGALTDTQTLTITVDDVNDTPVITSNGGGATASISVDENQTAVTTVTATDDDVSDTHTYSLGGTDASAFDIGSTDGVLTFNLAPDHEVKETYVVDVIVTDNGTGALTDTQTLTITVDNVNDAPVITSDGGGAIAPISVAENQTAVTTVTVADDDVSDTHTYSLGGTDAGAFDIGSTDGVLTFNPAPDHEAKDTYVVNVIVTDNGTGALTDTQTLTITVDDINDAPVITSNGGGNMGIVSVDENQTAVTTVTVTDDDVSDTHIYSLGGTDASAFAIGSSDGVLTFNPAPDHEAKDIYVVDVIVKDSGTGALTDTQTLTITVDDINDAPVITSNGGGNTGTVSVDENQTAVTTVTVTDDDTADTHTYSLSGADANAFDIDSSDGVLTFNPAPDYETKDSYVVDVIVTDNGMGALSDTQTLTITVDDVNDAPVITSNGGGATAPISVDENQTAVTTVTVMDDDTTDAHTYSLSGTDASAFDIGSSNGVLTFNPAPDHETKDNYVVDVIVTDSGTSALTDTQTLTITVNDVNDAPVITSNGGGNTGTVSVDENQTAVTTVTVTDDDAGDTHTYSLSGLDASAFDIGSSDGVLTFNPAPDHEAEDTYVVDVIVTDNGTGALTDIQTLTITVDDVNDAPVITSNGGGATAAISVNENQTAVTTVTVTDDDAGDTHTYNLSGTDASAFDIGLTDGVLTFNPAPDHEAKDTYVVDVIVTDSGTGVLTDTQTLTITVDDINDAPVINSDGGASTASIVVTENQTSVTTVIASDEDMDDTRSYSLDGADAHEFTIGGLSGVLTFNSAPDHESRDIYVVDAIVTDSRALTDTQTLTISVADVDEAPIVMDDTLTAKEDSTLFIDTNQDLMINDLDPEGGELRFASFDQPKNGLLILDDEGVLEYWPEANFNGIDFFDYTVSDETENTTMGRVSIDVLPVNDPPVLAAGAIDGSDAPAGMIDADEIADGVIEVGENNMVVGQVAGLDVDGDAVSYSLAGPDASAFEIDPSTGVLRPVNALDFESPSDVNGDNRYDLEIFVTDESGGQVKVPLAVTTTDTNEPPQLIESTFVVEEGFSGEFGRLEAIDLDAGDELVFELSTTGATLQGLSLLPDGRLVTDGLSPGTYEIDVLVRDSGELISIGSVSVRVDPLSDGLPSLGASLPVDVEKDELASLPSTTWVKTSIAFTPAVHLKAPIAVVLASNLTDGVSESLLPNEQYDTRESFITSLQNVQRAVNIITSVYQTNEISDESVVSGGIRFDSLSLKMSQQLVIDLMAAVRTSFDNLNVLEEQEVLEQEFEKKVTIVVGFGTISAGIIGYTAWLLASNALLAATFSTVSMWRTFDPLPVLLDAHRDKDEEEKPE